MDKYLLTIPGSSVDSFYESDTYPIEGDFSHARFICNSAGGCPLNVGAVCASKGMKVKTLEILCEQGKRFGKRDHVLRTANAKRYRIA